VTYGRCRIIGAHTKTVKDFAKLGPARLYKSERGAPGRTWQNAAELPVSASFAAEPRAVRRPRRSLTLNEP